jgi:hypothetical protein
MSDVTQTLAFALLVICLGACLICAFRELELVRQRHRARSRLVRDAMRTVLPVIKRGK